MEWSSVWKIESRIKGKAERLPRRLMTAAPANPGRFSGIQLTHPETNHTITSNAT